MIRLAILVALVATAVPCLAQTPAVTGGKQIHEATVTGHPLWCKNDVAVFSNGRQIVAFDAASRTQRSYPIADAIVMQCVDPSDSVLIAQFTPASSAHSLLRLRDGELTTVGRGWSFVTFATKGDAVSFAAAAESKSQRYSIDHLPDGIATVAIVGVERDRIDIKPDLTPAQFSFLSWQEYRSLEWIDGGTGWGLLGDHVPGRDEAKVGRVPLGALIVTYAGDDLTVSYALRFSGRAVDPDGDQWKLCPRGKPNACEQRRFGRPKLAGELLPIAGLRKPDRLFFVRVLAGDSYCIATGSVRRDDIPCRVYFGRDSLGDVTGLSLSDSGSFVSTTSPILPLHYPLQYYLRILQLD